MLAIQLDSRALFVARWRESRCSRCSTTSAMRDAPQRREFRALLSRWKAEASSGCGGLPAGARPFAARRWTALWNSLTAGLLARRSKLRRPAQFEAAGWRLVNERPVAVAPPGGGDWRAFLLARVDATIGRTATPSAARSRTAPTASASRSRCAIRCRAPCRCCRGLLDMPHARTRRRPPHAARAGRRVRRLGAFRRFAGTRGERLSASCPGGPSGHPLSPFYRSGFEDWAQGVPTPFLPGPPAHKLVLRPVAAP